MDNKFGFNVFKKKRNFGKSFVGKKPGTPPFPSSWEEEGDALGNAH